MDHVLLTFGNLYNIYDTVLLGKIDNNVQEAILKSLKKQWKAADQTVFILAVIFNPFIRADPFSAIQLPRIRIWTLVKDAIACFWNKEASTETMVALQDYLGRKAEFSDERMELAAFKYHYATQVSFLWGASTSYLTIIIGSKCGSSPYLGVHGQ